MVSAEAELTNVSKTRQARLVMTFHLSGCGLAIPMPGPCLYSSQASANGIPPLLPRRCPAILAAIIKPAVDLWTVFGFFIGLLMFSNSVMIYMRSRPPVGHNT